MCESTERIDSLYGCRLLYFFFQELSIQSAEAYYTRLQPFARSDQVFTTGLCSIDAAVGRSLLLQTSYWQPFDGMRVVYRPWRNSDLQSGQSQHQLKVMVITCLTSRTSNTTRKPKPNVNMLYLTEPRPKPIM